MAAYQSLLWLSFLFTQFILFFKDKRSHRVELKGGNNVNREPSEKSSFVTGQILLELFGKVVDVPLNFFIQNLPTTPQRDEFKMEI